MQDKFYRKLSYALFASLTAAALFTAGCEGDKGDRGPAGPAGPGATGAFVNFSSMTTQQQADQRFSGEVTSVTIASPPVVRFRITDQNGNPVIGIGQRNTSGQLQNLKFTLGKLMPSVNGSPSRWVNYIVTTASTTPAPTRPTYDREGTLVDNGDGSYVYTFYRDITQAKSIVDATTDSGNNRKADLDDLTYDPTLTHRLVVEYGGNILNTSPSVPIKNALNIIYDFIPATGQTVTAANTQREIVDTSYCNQCHLLGVTTPHAGRVTTEYCVLCHTNQRAYGRALSTSTGNAFTGSTYVTEENGYREVFGNFMTMVHKIHMGNRLTKTGYNYAGVLFNDITYPQDPGLCRKCHRGDTAQELALTPQGNNWQTMPSRNACGACHDGANFATGAGHDGGVVQNNDATCTTCHPAPAIRGYHRQELLSPLNPETPAGLVNFSYEIASASVTGTTATVKFRILGDGTPVTLATPAATITNALASPTGNFSGSPAFLFAYAAPQNFSEPEPATQIPVDFNNRGLAAAQPKSVSIAQLLDTDNAATIGSIGTRDADGYYTATIVNAFPAGVSMRTVGMQSYFSQVLTGNTTVFGRHAVAVVKTVTGDTARRVVVDPEKCGKCHEYFEAHGGQRVYQTQVCVLCHNPNLSSSGRIINIAGLTPTQVALLTPLYPTFTITNAAFPLAFAETSNNFKEMIHGIHAGATRTTPFRDIRGDRFAVINGGEITFPNLLQNCEACHVTNTTTNVHTYASVPTNALPTTMVTRAVASPANAAAVLAGRATVPNDFDLVVGPMTGACVSCHDSPAAKQHMEANGARLGAALLGPSYTDMGEVRSTYLSSGGNNREQCILCHGEGRIADVVVEHQR